MNAQDLERLTEELAAIDPSFDAARVQAISELTDDDLVHECQGMEPGPFEPPAPRP